MDIVKVARNSGVPASKLRFYEAKGLIVSIGRRGLRRVFDPGVLERLALISLGRAAGFSLDEIARMFGPEGRPRIDRRMLAAKAQQRIENNHRTLWPSRKPGGRLSELKHWSDFTLAERTRLLGEPFDAMYRFEYPRLSWYVHSGLTGVANLPAEFFPNLYGYARALAFSCYTHILESVIHEMKIDRAVDKIHKALKLATLLPFSKTPEHQAVLCRELLG